MGRKIDELQERIKAIREERKLMASGGQSMPQPNISSNISINSAKTGRLPSLSGSKATKKKKKYERPYHPNLNFVVAEMAYSPYLVKPEVPYTLSAMRTAPTLSKLRFQTKEAGAPRILAKDLPVDLKKAKKKWISDVKNYVETHGHPGAKPRSSKKTAVDDNGSLGSITTVGSLDREGDVSPTPAILASQTVPSSFRLTGLPASPLMDDAYQEEDNTSPLVRNIAQLKPLSATTLGKSSSSSEPRSSSESPSKTRRRKKKKKGKKTENGNVVCDDVGSHDITSNNHDSNANQKKKDDAHVVDEEEDVNFRAKSPDSNLQAYPQHVSDVPASVDDEPKAGGDEGCEEEVGDECVYVTPEVRDDLEVPPEGSDLLTLAT
jgi:hypothetical protein